MGHTTEEFLLLALRRIESQEKQIETLYASHISLIKVVSDKLGIPSDELLRVPDSVIQSIRQKDPDFALAKYTALRDAIRELERRVPGAGSTDIH